MHCQFRKLLAAGLTTLALVQGACSRTATESQKSAAGKTTDAVLVHGNACDRKLLGKDDVAGLLSEPIESVETLQGDGQSCVFTSKNFSTVTVAVRPGLGDVTVSTLASGQGNQTVTPLAGVGERAVWNGVLKEVNATKGNVLCDISVVGPASGPATAEKVGALCDKIFTSS